MKFDDFVLIDTCIWVPFFNRPHSKEKQAVDSLLDDDRAALVGPVLAEVLGGFRRDGEAAFASSLLRGAEYLEVTWDDWREAAAVGRRLASRGHVLPLSDLAVAAVARRHDGFVYSTDPHFDLMQDLKRFWPEE
jgi:predicted nucleic acid-binding protein